MFFSFSYVWYLYVKGKIFHCSSEYIYSQIPLLISELLDCKSASHMIWSYNNIYVDFKIKCGN